MTIGMQQLKRSSVTLVGLFTVGFLGILGYARLTRPAEEPPRAVVRPPVSTPAPMPAPSPPEQAAAPPVAVVVPAPAPTPAPTPRGDTPRPLPAALVNRLSAQATGEDPKVRADAINALAKVSRLQAVPVLKRVLTAGNPRTDRPLAFQSLRTLAVEQGDVDGRIREVLRETIYHSDDDGTTQGAQAMLNDVEKIIAAGPAPAAR